MELDLEAIRALVMLAMDAKIRVFRLGDLEFAFDAPEESSSETVGFIPPQFAGRVEHPEDETPPEEARLPPAYRSLFRGRVPKFRGE